MTTDAATLVRQAYHTAEGDVLDFAGFKTLFTTDGVFQPMGGPTYQREHLADLLIALGGMIPDIHREIYHFHVMGDVVAVELSIQGTFSGPFHSPTGKVFQPNGSTLDVPCGDFWYVENDKIKKFNCHVSMNVMFTQMGILPPLGSSH